MRQTYIRFVTAVIDHSSGRRQGLFQAAADLRDANILSSHEVAEILSLQKWFDENLDAPDRFSRSRNARAASKAISWFKSSATEHVSRMYALCRILNEHGIATEKISTARPGYVVFEDRFQIAAEPFAETST